MKTKNHSNEDDNRTVQRDMETPPRKKLKQARLPFQFLSAGEETPSQPLKNKNKRKLESSDDIKVVKIIRPNETSQLCETKENVQSPSVYNDCKNTSDPKIAANESATKESGTSVQSSERTLSKCDTVTSQDDSGSSTDSIKNSDQKNKTDNKHKEKEILKCDKSFDVIVISDSEESLLKNSLNTEKDNTDLETSSPTLNLHLSDNEDIDSENTPTAAKTTIKDTVNKINSSAVDSDAVSSAADKSEQGTPVQKFPLNKDKTHSNDNYSKTSTANLSAPKNEITPEKSPTHSCADSVQKIKKLTPKQLQKKLDSAKKKEEKEKLRQERERKKTEEKEEREKKKAEEKEEKLRQKQEKEEQKKKEKEEREEQKRKEKEEREEQKKKEKEEKEEQKKKEKEEKERKRQIELELRNEEKRKKEDKRQAEVAAFTSFFLPKKAESKPPEEPKAKVEEKFMPFEVKADMRLAPNTRNNLTSKLKLLLDEALKAQNEKELYLNQLKQKEIIPRCATSTWALSDLKDDVVILDDDEINNVATNSVIETYPAASGQMPKPKLIQFWENRRPPYWGTWRKKSNLITPVNPFSKDEKYFDYEVDSDDEWEEEEPGESLHGSEDEKESEDEYEVDNEFFVPHGYLSDEEHEGEDEVQSPEKMKTKLKLLELEFEEEMKQKTERLKPRLIGCIWIDPKNTDSVGGQLLKLLSPYQAVYQDSPISINAPDPTSTSVSPESNVSAPAVSSAKKKSFPTEGISPLIKLIHGNINRREFLTKEFVAYWSKEQHKLQGETSGEESVVGTPLMSHCDIVKRSVSNKIKELATWIACPEEGPMFGRMCWYVPPQIRESHGLSDLSLPNTIWTYTYKPKRHKSDIQTSTGSPAATGESTPRQLITKFTKPMTEVERKKQFAGNEVKSGNDSSCHSEKTQRKLVFNSRNVSNNSLEKRKKVPIMVSGPRGQELPKSTTLSLMKFMKPHVSGETKETCVPKVENKESKDDGKLQDADEDCILLE